MSNWIEDVISSVFFKDEIFTAADKLNVSEVVAQAQLRVNDVNIVFSNHFWILLFLETLIMPDELCGVNFLSVLIFRWSLTIKNSSPIYFDISLFL